MSKLTQRLSGGVVESEVPVTSPVIEIPESTTTSSTFVNHEGKYIALDSKLSKEEEPLIAKSPKAVHKSSKPTAVLPEERYPVRTRKPKFMEYFVYHGSSSKTKT